MPPSAVSQPLAPPPSSPLDLPHPDLEWYENSSVIQPAASKDLPESGAVTPNTSLAPVNLDLSSSNDDFRNMCQLTITFLVDVGALMLSLTVDDHENQLGLVEQEFGKMKATIQQLVQKITQLERALLQQQSSSACQQQAPLCQCTTSALFPKQHLLPDYHLQL